MTKTHTMRSRLISLVLVLVMVLGCLPLSALAWDAMARELRSMPLSLTAIKMLLLFWGRHMKSPLSLS